MSRYMSQRSGYLVWLISSRPAIKVILNWNFCKHFWYVCICKHSFLMKSRGEGLRGGQQCFNKFSSHQEGLLLAGVATAAFGLDPGELLPGGKTSQMELLSQRNGTRTFRALHFSSLFLLSGFIFILFYDVYNKQTACSLTCLTTFISGTDKITNRYSNSCRWSKHVDSLEPIQNWRWLRTEINCRTCWLAVFTYI